jgi:hypothetical protein
MTFQDSSNSTLHDGIRNRLTGNAIGDLFWSNASKRLGRIAIGLAGQAIVVNETTNGYVWVTPILSGGAAGGDLTNNFPNPTINNNAVSFAKFQNIPTATILGRSSPSTGNVEALTVVQIQTLLGLGDAAYRTVGTSVNNLVQVLSGGKIDPNLVPSVAIGNVQSVATNAAKLALTGLTAGESTVRVLADETRGGKGSTYALAALPASTEANWILLSDEQVDAGDIVSGVIAPARLGTSPAADKVLYGDGVFRAISTGVLPFEIAAVNTAMLLNRRYVTNAVSKLDMTLPAVAAPGDIIELKGYGSGGWKILQNAGQSIKLLDKDSTVGTGGYIETEITLTASYAASLTLVCVVTNTGWLATDLNGVVNIV